MGFFEDLHNMAETTDIKNLSAAVHALIEKVKAMAEADTVKIEAQVAEQVKADIEAVAAQIPAQVAAAVEPLTSPGYVAPENPSPGIPAPLNNPAPIAAPPIDDSVRTVVLNADPVPEPVVAPPVDTNTQQ
jgi:hypothetical protein